MTMQNTNNTYKTKGYADTMKQQARPHADLDAMLIGQKTVPKGCRVLNVSPQGMMLQCEPDGRLLTFRDADLVDIHLTVHHGGSRKKFAIPAIVNRVDIKSIDVVFQHPNSELLKLIEAYRISDAHMMEASIAHSPQEAVTKVTALPNIKANQGGEETEDSGSRQGSRRILYPVLATVILSVCIAAGAYLYTSGIDSRLNVLETITINQTNELAEIRSRIFSSSLQEGRYASLNARLQALTDAFGTLEGKLDTVISGRPVVASKTATDTVVSTGNETPISISPENSANNRVITAAISQPQAAENNASQNLLIQESLSAPAPDLTSSRQGGKAETREAISGAVMTAAPDKAEIESATVTDQPDTAGIGNVVNEESAIRSSGVDTSIAASTGSGPWIINLLSSRKKEDTDRLAEIAADNGIPVIQSRAIVKGKEYWRLQVTGFGNATEAKNYAIPVKKKLDIKDVWIFKQKGD
jgi:hypothetical protein